MHYEIGRGHATALEEIDAPGQDPTHSPTPPGVEQGDDPLARRHQIDRDAVGDRDQEHQPECGSRMAVQPVQQTPPLAPLVPSDFGAMYLMPEDPGVEARFAGAKLPPAPQHFPDRGRRP
jgi:hypothetical protein